MPNTGWRRHPRLNGSAVPLPFCNGERRGGVVADVRLLGYGRRGYLIESGLDDSPAVAAIRSR